MNKKTLYLDNAATTYPKPPQVARAVAEYIANIGVNVNRGGYAKAYDCLLYTSRVYIAAEYGENYTIIFSGDKDNGFTAELQ